MNEIIPNKLTLEAINDAREGKLHSADTIEEFKERMDEKDQSVQDNIIPLSDFFFDIFLAHIVRYFHEV